MQINDARKMTIELFGIDWTKPESRRKDESSYLYVLGWYYAYWASVPVVQDECDEAFYMGWADCRGQD